MGGFGVSSFDGSSSSSSNRTAGAITADVVVKEPAPISANGAFESIKSNT